MADEAQVVFDLSDIFPTVFGNPSFKKGHHTSFFLTRGKFMATDLLLSYIGYFATKNKYNY